MNTPTPETEKLSSWTKIGYGLGDIYGGGSGVVISFYYLIFLTDVVRINPALAGTQAPLSGGTAPIAVFHWVLRIILAAVPVVLLALVFARKYPLTSQVHQRLNRVLASRRVGDVRQEEDREKLADLQKLLIGS